MTIERKCPICDQPATIDQSPSSRSIHRISCMICGHFYATKDFKDDFPAERDRHPIYLIQGALREREMRLGRPSIILFSRADEAIKHNAKSSDHLTALTIKDLLVSASFPKTPMGKIDKFLENISVMIGDSFQPAKIKQDNDYPLAYVRNREDFKFLLGEASSLGYLLNLNLSTSSADGHKTEIHLSIQAWQRIEELKKVNLKSNQGFIACTFRPEHKHQTFRKAMRQGVENAKFEPHSKTILEKGLGEIRRSRFVIADLTHESKSVIFEAGFAFGLGIEIILLCRKDYWEEKKKAGEDIEFYTSNYQILHYEDEKDLAKKVEDAIRARVESR